MIMGVAADQLKKNGAFKLAGMLNLKLKKNAATKARKGVSPFTKEPCVFNGRSTFLGVKQIAIGCNKMDCDTAGYKLARYEEVSRTK